MFLKRGTIALMGSGELTSTMVEVHKELLGSIGGSPRAVFLDTPAGFQLNAEDLAQRAVRYFLDRVRHPMSVASFKSRTSLTTHEAEKAHRALRESDYILIGPGSPTYAVSQWRNTPIPEIFIEVIEAGGCLVAASAAALTVGHSTLPVYEIYKVGADLHWVDGLHLLEHFGFPLVVIPHWNNAEGGTHDTRFCYMGEPRFRELERLLPAGVSVLGLDEHTACLLNLQTGEAVIKGIGRVTLRRGGREITFERGERFPLDVLRGGAGGGGTAGMEDHRWRDQEPSLPAPTTDEESPDAEKKPDAEEESSFWRRVQAAEALFEQGVETRSPVDLASALLDLDRIVWKGQQDLENPEFIAQARERFRELIARLGSIVEVSPSDRTEWLAPLAESLIRLRERYRHEKRWSDADVLRESLHEAGIVVEDTPSGARWRIEQMSP
jgi:peptidase E